MLTMLQTAAYYLDVPKAERDAEAAVGRTKIFNGMTDNDVAAYRERRLRLRELMAQREALGVVLELNVPATAQVEALPLVPVQTPAEQAERERRSPVINVFAVGVGDADEPEAETSYPDTFLVLLPPSADGTLRSQPLALLLTREELAELRACGGEALLDGSVRVTEATETTGGDEPTPSLPSIPEPRPISVSRPLARPFPPEEQAS